MKKYIKTGITIVLVIILILLSVFVNLLIIRKEARVILIAARMLSFTWSMLFLCIIILDSIREHFYKRLYDVAIIKKVKTITKYAYYLSMGALVVLIAAVVIHIIDMSRVGKKQFNYISPILLIVICILTGYYFWNLRKIFLYFKSKSNSTIQAAYYVQKHEESLEKRKLQESYKFLLKACEVLPDNIELCCRAASFCEMVLQDANKADDLIGRARVLVEANKNLNNKSLACYENYKGIILCNRENFEEGYQHIEKSIELDPTPTRITNYKKMRSEIRQKETQKPPIPNDGIEG